VVIRGAVAVSGEECEECEGCEARVGILLGGGWISSPERDSSSASLSFDFRLRLARFVSTLRLIASEEKRRDETRVRRKWKKEMKMKKFTYVFTK
jgi:hypothetical protein